MLQVLEIAANNDISIITMFVLILYLGLINHYTYGQSIVNFITMQNTLLTGSVLVQNKKDNGQRNISKLSCVNLCLTWNECHSVSWKIDQSECSLHSVFGIELPNQMAESSEWVTFEKGEYPR